MTIQEMREKVYGYCERTRCSKCVLNDRKWDVSVLGLEKDCPDIMDCTERDLDTAVTLIKEYHDRISNNPYWDNITKIANAQREKGLQEYGQGLEHNIAPVLDRIQHIEEELVDTLMYLEWLKESLEDV